MRGLGESGAYNKLRFEWKKQVNASPDISRSAKHMAAWLCDTYVNKNTGKCWPKNETLANGLDIDKRSVQRHLKELQVAGWLRNVSMKNIRRAFQIAFPNGSEGDSEHDTLRTLEMTETPPKNDRTVTRYNKNQGDNQEMTPSLKPPMRYIPINRNEQLSIAEWKDWVNEHTDHDLTKMSALLRRGSVYLLPSRFPSSDESDRYLDFFTAVMTSEGRCFE